MAFPRKDVPSAAGHLEDALLEEFGATLPRSVVHAVLSGIRQELADTSAVPERVLHVAAARLNVLRLELFPA